LLKIPPPIGVIGFDHASSARTTSKQYYKGRVDFLKLGDSCRMSKEKRWRGEKIRVKDLGMAVGLRFAWPGVFPR
jgi:hypothetical protein